MSSDPNEIDKLLEELIRRDTTFRIAWHHLSKLWRLNIPWRDKEYTGKSMLEVLRAAVEDI